jgi:peptidoglycan-N-acetylglucosamine deacetylase
VERRRLLFLLAVGSAAAITGCAENKDTASARSAAGADGSAAPTPSASAGSSFPAPKPGKPRILTEAPEGSRQIALTIDDGYDGPTVDAFVEFAQKTGIPITFSPNGAFQHQWNPHRYKLRPLIEAGQVQIGNHTFSHKDMRERTDAQIKADIEKNERWIQKAFLTTARPYFRPPYGSHDARTDAAAASLGFTSILMWNATLGDDVVLPPRKILQFAKRYFTAGALVVGHANHLPVTTLFDELAALIKARKLEPATLDMMFGTTRATG